MLDERKINTGIKLLIEKYRKKFQIPENFNHYSKKDFQEAEKKYIKYRLFHGGSRNFRKGD